MKLSLALLLALALPAFAQDEVLEDNTPIEQESLSDELSGILVDRTMTLAGKNFFQFFSNFWNANYPGSDAIISIHERPSARFGSQIWLEYNGTQYAKQFVGPRQANRTELPEAIAQYMYQEIQKQKLVERMLDTFDLERSEL